MPSRYQLLQVEECLTVPFRFNSARGVTCDQVDEILRSATYLIWCAKPPRPGTRSDPNADYRSKRSDNLFSVRSLKKFTLIILPEVD